MPLMNAPHHEMQRVRCAGHVENPCDDRQDADDRQDDGQRPPAGRRGCGMHVIHLLLCEMLWAALGGGPAAGPARLGAAPLLAPGEAGAEGSPRTLDGAASAAPRSVPGPPPVASPR